MARIPEPSVSVNGLHFGPGTPYAVVEFNPWRRRTRTESQPRAWNHGSWSGAEWGEEAIVPLVLAVRRGNPFPQASCPKDSPAAEDAWMELQQALSAAFAPIGDAVVEGELRWTMGSRSYIMFGRPRVVEPDTRSLWMNARATCQCVFVGLDPRYYSDPLTVVSTGLSETVGGLTVPFTVPFVIPGFLVGGALTLTNEGTAPAPLFIRIDGPVINPRLILTAPNGATSTINFFDLTLNAGEWVEIDTASGTALLNGEPGSSVRGSTVWTMDPYPLLPGVSTLRFLSSEYNDSTMVTVEYRSAWW